MRLPENFVQEVLDRTDIEEPRKFLCCVPAHILTALQRFIITADITLRW